MLYDSTNSAKISDFSHNINKIQRRNDCNIKGNPRQEYLGIIIIA